MSTDASETKSFGQVILKAIEGQLRKYNYSMPCYVLSYDLEENFVTVQPAFKVLFNGESVAVDLPPIANVPVVMPKTANAHLRLPIKPNDEGMLIFQQRSIDNWIANGGVVDPDDFRMLALSDAVFVMGLHSSKQPLQPKEPLDCLEVSNGDGYIAIDPSGKFKITNGTTELISTLSDITLQLSETLQALSTTLVTTSLGPQPLSTASQFSALKIQVDDLKSKLDEIKKD